MTDGDDPRISDEALREVLEIAVGVAAAGSKMRPALRYPSGLKPFLRFHKLSDGALRTVRGVVDADVKFRSHLGKVATLDLVDEVGLLWLQRPDGWQERAVDAAAALQPVVDVAGELRREERRRAAAEQRAITANEQLAAAQAELDAVRADSQRSARDRTRQVEGKASVASQLADAQRRIAKLERALSAAEQRLAEMTERADADAASLRDVTEARDHLLAQLTDGSPGGGVDPGEWWRVVTAAAEETRAVATRLAALVSIDRDVRRQPVALPGAVHGVPAAAAEFLMRVDGVRVLIDGYNVAKLAWPDDELEQQRLRCIAAAEEVARRYGTAITVVFDGSTVIGAAASKRRLVAVEYSPEGVLADEVLGNRVRSLPAKVPVVVVTNDREVIARTRGSGANTLPSEHFLALARR